ncbi:MAG: cytidylate kinase family protein [bacterium]
MKESCSLRNYFRDRLINDDQGVRYPFVTISRQEGAGAHTLASELMRQMNQRQNTEVFAGWNLFDVATYEGFANDPELQATLDAVAKEEYHSEVTDLFLEVISKLPQQYVVCKKLFTTMRKLAAMGKVILIGRAGCCVTRSVPGGIHLRLVAPEALRVERVMKLQQLDKTAATAWVHSHDRERAHLLRDFFSRDIEDPLLYDAVWNTQSTSVVEIADITRRMIFKRVRDKIAQRM